jgi:hypothetical protein
LYLNRTTDLAITFKRKISAQAKRRKIDVRIRFPKFTGGVESGDGRSVSCCDLPLTSSKPNEHHDIERLAVTPPVTKAMHCR